jgi:hypothetical protein
LVRQISPGLDHQRNPELLSLTCNPWRRPLPAGRTTGADTRFSQAKEKRHDDDRHRGSAPVETDHHSQLRRAVIASTVGTTIEWYDFLLYSTVTGLVFGKLFFPKSDPIVGVLEAFAVYTVGSVATAPMIYMRLRPMPCRP